MSDKLTGEYSQHGREAHRIIGYENRYILILLAAIMNQNPLQLMKKRLNWDLVLDISNYQEVNTVVYVGLLGLEKNISEEYEIQFHQSYKKGLLLCESYVKVEEVIMWQLERYGIDALFLLGADAADMYPKPEMAHIGQIEILVDKKDLPQINRFMLEMAYEQTEDPACSGIIYTRVPGIRIVFYDRIPVENKSVGRFFTGTAKRYQRKDSYKYIHVLTNEEAYVYRIAKMVERYITGKLKIRDIMDLWQYRKLLGEKFRWREVEEVLEKAGWQEFARQAELLAMLWFGEDAEEQYSFALELEEYILSRGRENKHLDGALLPYEKVRLDFYWRNRDKEWKLRKQAWMFPSREYMVHFFPVLERYPFLLIFCWAVRYIRFNKRIYIAKCKQIGFRIRIRLSDIEEKLKGMIGKKDMEEISENPEEIPEEISEEVSGSEPAAIPQGEENKEESKDERLADGSANLDKTEGEKEIEEFKDQS